MKINSCTTTYFVGATYDECNFLVDVPLHRPRDLESLPPGTPSQEDIYELLDGLGAQNWLVQMTADSVLNAILEIKRINNLTPFGLSDLPWLNDPAGTTAYGNNVVRKAVIQEVFDHGSNGSMVLFYSYKDMKSNAEKTGYPEGTLIIAGTSESNYIYTTHLGSFDATGAHKWFYERTIGAGK